MRIITIIILVVSLIGCGKSIKELSFQKDKLVVFGEEKDNKPGIIGDMGFMAISKNLDLYVIDRAYKKIKKYSKEGIFIRDYGKGEGRGPGEFMNPFGIDVDEEGSIYVMDIIKMEVTVFDSLNTIKKIFKTSFTPANMVVTRPGILYITGLPMTYEDELIYKYDLNQENNYDKPIMKFCERIDPKNNEALKHNRTRVSMIKDFYGNIFINPTYPYLIRKYDEKGNLLDSYTREIKNFDAPYHKMVGDKKVNMKDNGIIDPIYLNDKILGIRVYQNVLEKQYIDFYNIEDKSYMGLINSESLDVKASIQIKGDGKGNIYYSLNEPYPHIVKIKINLGVNK